jgi:HEAT repeat protein
LKCQRARRALVALGVPVIPHLVKALRSKKQWVRWEAAKALGEIRDPAATRALVAALEDKMFDVRWLAAEGLIAIGPLAVVPLLRALIRHPDSLWMREGAHHALHDMKKGELDKILQPVIAALEEIDFQVLVPPAAQAALEEILKLHGIEL